MSKDSSFVKECERMWNSKDMQEIFDASLENKGEEASKRNPKKIEKGLKSYAKWLGETYGAKAKT